ncbi:MAG: lipoyl(octanoyl) transferase [Candidatus Omnitrophota bacterium]|jgi:lipoyl(octanoyl) transferase|nr:MAG: lipoyl(octanoyl) transferase [Candidatus Omnitrophota bacterium]
MALDSDYSLPVLRWDSSIAYAETARRQEEFVAQGKEALIFCEHPPTITLGTGADESDLSFSPIDYENRGISIHKSPRGGKATYHGPGQLVCYPILNLRQRTMTIHAYLRFLENSMSSLCNAYEIKTHTIEGKTGVWVEDRKIGFIGVRIRRGFAFHGCSINITPQQEAFQQIVPCGMPNLKVTSLQEETCKTYALWDVADTMRDIFYFMMKNNGVIDS